MIKYCDVKVGKLFLIHFIGLIFLKSRVTNNIYLRQKSTHNQQWKYKVSEKHEHYDLLHLQMFNCDKTNTLTFTMRLSIFRFSFLTIKP